ncbi:MAG: spore coat protein CotJB [Clostridia bacterium]|nr:spore coat protein CotJB [Clostridia bacterium]
MNNREALKKKIHALDFAIHELVLFLDTHPTSKKALELLREYRQKRKDCIALYEEKYGPYIVTPADVSTKNGCWQWLESPWPWENEEV